MKAVFLGVTAALVAGLYLHHRRSRKESPEYKKKVNLKAKRSQAESKYKSKQTNY